MLLRHRSTRADHLGAGFAERAVLHSQFQFFVKERRGILCDDRLFGVMPPMESDDASYLVLPLEGELKVRAGEEQHALPVGEYLSDRRSRPRSMRQEGTQLSLVIDWRPGFLGSRSTDRFVGRLSRRSLEGLRAATLELASPELETRGASIQVRRILAILRAEGLPFDPVEAGDLVEEVPAPFCILSRAMDRAFSSLEAGPALGDLQAQLGWSRSGLHRRLTEFWERYGHGPAPGWRDALHRYRLLLGSAMMCAQGATTEGVAKLLGYASPKAFCYAFAKAGLPSPGAVQEALRRLG